MYNFCLGGVLKPAPLSSEELQEPGATSKSDKNGREPVFCCRNELSSILTPEVCLISMLLLNTGCVYFFMPVEVLGKETCCLSC